MPIAYSIDIAAPKEENKPQILTTITVLGVSIQDATVKTTTAYPSYEIRNIRKVFEITIP